MLSSKNLVTITSTEIAEHVKTDVSLKEFSQIAVEIAALKSNHELEEDYLQLAKVSDYAFPQTLNRLAGNDMLDRYQVYPILGYKNTYETTTALITGTQDELKKFDGTQVVGWELFSEESSGMSLKMDFKPTAYTLWVLQSGDEGNLTSHGSFASEEDAVAEVMSMCERDDFIEGMNLSKVEYAEHDTLAGTFFTYNPHEESVSTVCVTTMHTKPTETLLEADFYMVSLPS